VDHQVGAKSGLVAIFFDFGDTLADESTEIKDASQTTQVADLIPGAAELLRELHRRGYPLALVADGRPGTYDNVLTQHNLRQLFSVFAVSETLGVEKPQALMFTYAMDQLGIPADQASRVMMVGNRLDRDVLGANMLGLISVWLDWSPRYSKIPQDDSEIPQHRITAPLELLQVIDALKGPGRKAAELSG